MIHEQSFCTLIRWKTKSDWNDQNILQNISVFYERNKVSLRTTWGWINADITFIFWGSCFFKRKETAIQTFNVWNATNGLYIGIKKKAFPRHPTRSSHTQEIRSRRDTWIAMLWFCSVISAQNCQQQESPRQIYQQWAQTVQTKLYKPTSEQPQKHKHNLLFQNKTPQTARGDLYPWCQMSLLHISSSYSSC